MFILYGVGFVYAVCLLLAFLNLRDRFPRRAAWFNSAPALLMAACGLYSATSGGFYGLPGDYGRILFWTNLLIVVSSVQVARGVRLPGFIVWIDWCFNLVVFALTVFLLAYWTAHGIWAGHGPVVELYQASSLQPTSSGAESLVIKELTSSAH